MQDDIRRHLLKVAMATPASGTEDETVVFPLPEEPRYLLKLSHPDLSQDRNYAIARILNTHTALAPVGIIFPYFNLGQTLAIGVGPYGEGELQLVQRVEGESLSSISRQTFEQQYEHYKSDGVNVDIAREWARMDTIVQRTILLNSIPDAEWENFFKLGMEAVMSGASIDTMNAGNFLYKNGSMAYIDLANQAGSGRAKLDPKFFNVEYLTRVLITDGQEVLPLDPLVRQAADRISQIATQAGVPQNAEEAANLLRRHGVTAKPLTPTPDILSLASPQEALASAVKSFPLLPPQGQYTPIFPSGPGTGKPNAR